MTDQNKLKEGGDGRGGADPAHSLHDPRLKMMSDVLTQPQAHSTPPPGSNPAELNHNLEVGGGVAVGGVGFTPSHERLQRRMSGYRSNSDKHFNHLDATTNALNNQHREDTKKLMKKFVDNNKPKKTTKSKQSATSNNDNSSSKANNMKPQIQQANGLKRPHPGANNTSSSTSDVLGGSAAGVNSAASEAKRMNLDQNNVDSTAIKHEVKPK